MTVNYIPLKSFGRRRNKTPNLYILYNHTFEPIMEVHVYGLKPGIDLSNRTTPARYVEGYYIDKEPFLWATDGLYGRSYSLRYKL